MSVEAMLTMRTPRAEGRPDCGLCGGDGWLYRERFGTAGLGEFWERAVECPECRPIGPALPPLAPATRWDGRVTV